ncbi:sensor domain-containing diguanylate cyclase [Ramlibacter humi]|uniref:Diguanylate cyclase n=1 Tax=Ramlibacter humi TaxID=2530451 RepID=A0A4Z0BWJ1_9BURK|nr:7TM diverse intracellular signaling domain-containing protein [Ramlibacter humi]TFZ03696.1 diguanylate cyclase [Ramlibacter humi]
MRGCLIVIRWLAALAVLACGLASAQPRLPVVVLPSEHGVLPLDGLVQFWEEPGREYKVEEIVAEAASLPWATRPPGKQHRLDGKALWLRFDVDMRDSKPWYVTLSSSGIDRVQLFRRAADGRWVALEAGDSVPVSRWPVPGRLPTFELANTGAPMTYYVRVEHDRVDFGAELTLYSQAELLAAREREQLLMGAYFGIAALLAVVALANAALYRDRNFLAYAVYLIIFTLGQVAYLGIGAQHLWDRWLDWNASSTFLLPGLSAVAALWFVQVVTEPARFSRVLNLVVWALILALLVAVLFDTWTPSRPIFVARLMLTSAALVVVSALIGLVWQRGDQPDIRLIALGFVPVMVMALFPLARGFGLIPNSIFTRYGLAIGAAVEMPILFYAMTLRGSRRREAQARASALPKSDALTGLADLRTLMPRLEDVLARARSQKHACALLGVRLANHDVITAEYGRETLDRALVVAASHLRRAASDMDMAARVGERDFALVLEGPTTPDVATSRAQQLVASGLRQAQALPNGLTLKLQVVIAMLPAGPPDAESILQWVAETLSAFPPDSRKQIRALNT